MRTVTSDSVTYPNGRVVELASRTLMQGGVTRKYRLVGLPLVDADGMVCVARQDHCETPRECAGSNPASATQFKYLSE